MIETANNSKKKDLSRISYETQDSAPNINLGPQTCVSWDWRSKWARRIQIFEESKHTYQPYSTATKKINLSTQARKFYCYKKYQKYINGAHQHKFYCYIKYQKSEAVVQTYKRKFYCYKKYQKSEAVVQT